MDAPVNCSKLTEMDVTIGLQLLAFYTACFLRSHIKSLVNIWSDTKKQHAIELHSSRNPAFNRTVVPIMLPQSNSNAALRRAKSTSTTSSHHHRTSTSIDPFVTRHHAEVAAVEAYQRARHLKDQGASVGSRQVPQKPQRRRSQATGKTEGSHFEDARLGRRRSTSKKGDCGNAHWTRAQQSRRSEPAADSTNGEERIATRKRSVIPLYASSGTSQQEHMALPSSARHSHRSQVGYTDGSPAPRRSSAMKQRSSMSQFHSGEGHRSDTYDGTLANLSNFQRRSEDDTTQVTRMSRSSEQGIRETQTDEQVLAIARDKCLQDFQQRKLRERKSFLLAPFQRRRAANLQKSSESSYDTYLPPFNYADDALPLPPPPPPPNPPPVPEVAILSTAGHVQPKNRNVSESVKARFKKVFRKVSRVPSGLPVQHIEAKQFHYPIESPLPTPELDPEKEVDPFTVSSRRSHLQIPQIRTESPNSRGSVVGLSTAKSRVTSWTTSTLAGTWSTRAGTARQEAADEYGALKRSGSVSTLRKAKSFFGRPVKNKLRHPTGKLELQSSEESTGLYSALQERIKPSESASQAANSDSETQSRAASALATLPSQRVANASVSSRARFAAPTIRSVTPDPMAFMLDIPSPVAEVYSPDNTDVGGPKEVQRSKEQDSESTPRSHLRRRPAVKAPTPTKEQIAQRIERTKFRWQAPLNELSPALPRSMRGTMMDDNPYELPSLTRALQQPATHDDLPRHTRIDAPSNVVRRGVLSPSVYSRNTDGASPRPDTPVEQGGMLVTITGREVRSYSISPPKREQPVERAVQTSREWRKWLSDEMNGWDGSTLPEDFTLSQQTVPGLQAAEKNDGATAKQSSGHTLAAQTRLGDASPTMEACASIEPRPTRPRASSRRSSFMNERYPMMDNVRNSSDRSVQTGRKISSKSDSRTSSAEQTVQSGFGNEKDGTAAGGDGARPRSALGRGSVLSKRQSRGDMQPRRPSGPGQNNLPMQDEGDDTLKSSLEPHDSKVASTSTAATTLVLTNRPKSAFDLRANYRARTASTARPIEVRRKTHDPERTPLLHAEDSTILNISAGPYASTPDQTSHITTTAGDENKENTAPSDATAGLPALSSAEWLGAGVKHKREAGRSPNAVHPAYRQRSVSRASPPSRNGTPGGSTGGGSPGQRMVTNWLDGKKEKEGTPAFV